MDKKKQKPTQTKEQAEKENQLFIAYNSVFQPRKEVFNEIFPDPIPPETKVFITEKVHGVNFSIILDVERNGYLLGKRNSLITMFVPLDTDIADLKFYFVESFFQNHIIAAMKPLKEKLVKIFDLLKDSYKEAKHFYLFGELFGGFYQQEDTKKFKPIQTEVKYSSQPLIYLFDIFVDKVPLKYEEFLKIVEQAEFPSVPVLEIKQFGELIDLKEGEVLYKYKDYITTVPGKHHEVEIADNYAEGVVFCFLTHKLKVKSDKFFEVAVAPKEKPQKKAQTDPFFDRITPARVQNVMTKEGNEAKFEVMYEKLKEDIFKDMKMENLFEGFDYQKNEKKYLGRAKGLYTAHLKKLEGN